MLRGDPVPRPNGRGIFSYAAGMQFPCFSGHFLLPVLYRMMYNKISWGRKGEKRCVEKSDCIGDEPGLAVQYRAGGLGVQRLRIHHAGRIYDLRGMRIGAPPAGLGRVRGRDGGHHPLERLFPEHGGNGGGERQRQLAHCRRHLLPGRSESERHCQLAGGQLCH